MTTTKCLCYRCGKVIKPGTAVALELNTYTGIFTAKGVPEDESQGFFDFGPECGPKSEGKAVEYFANVRMARKLKNK